MKKILLLISMLWGIAYGQSTGYLRYDTVRIEKGGGNAELIIMNATRNVTGGVLTNLGNGRTGFVTPSGGGTGGLSGGNLGSQFRLYVPGSSGIKTLANTYAFNWDSVTANVLSGRIDTTLMATRLYQASQLQLKLNTSDSASMLGGYVRSNRFLDTASNLRTTINSKQPLGTYITRVGTIDSLTKNSNGARVSNVSLIMQSADTTYPGLVSTGEQKFAGLKKLKDVPADGDSTDIIPSTAWIKRNITTGSLTINTTVLTGQENNDTKDSVIRTLAGSTTLENVKLFDSEIGKNKYDNNGTHTPGFHFNSSGVATANAGSSISPYIPVSPNTAYKASGFEYDASTFFIVVYYDENLNQLSYSSLGATGHTTPSGCYFVRFTEKFNDIGQSTANIQYELGSTATSFEPYSVTQYIDDDLIRPAAVIPNNTTLDSMVTTNTDGDFINIKMLQHYHGKNLFDSTAVLSGFSLNSSGNPTSSASGSISAYIPVKELTGYTISGIGYDYSSFGIASFYNSALTKIGNTAAWGVASFLTPPGTAYVRFTTQIFANERMSDIQFEENSVRTHYANYFDKQIIDSSRLIPTSHKIDYFSTDKIILVSNSYGQGAFGLLNKNYIGRLSALSDYNFENISRSGFNIEQLANTMTGNDKVYNSAYGIQDMNGKYALIIELTNSLNSIINVDDDLDGYVTSYQKAIRNAKALGMKPIVATQWRMNYDSAANPHSRTVISELRELSKREGVPFIDITGPGEIFDNDQSNRRWGGIHPGTLTESVYSYELKRALDELLPRPVQSMKIFKKRTAQDSAKTALYYKTLEERDQRFMEIAVSQGAIKPEDTLYYDDLQDWIDASKTNGNYSDYLKLLSNTQTMTVGQNYSIIEAVLPGDAAHVTNVKLELPLTSGSVQIWVKNNLTGTYDSLTTGTTAAIFQTRKYMDVDKVTFLLYKVGGYSLQATPVITWEGTPVKDPNNYVEPLRLAAGSNVLPKTSFEDADIADWGISNRVPGDGQNPEGTTDVGYISGSTIATQDFSITNTAQGRDIQIEIWARRWIDLFAHESSSPPVNTDSYDYATLEVNINDKAASNTRIFKQVPAHWARIIITTHINAGQTNLNLALKSSDSKEIEFAYASIKYMDADGTDGGGGSYTFSSPLSESAGLVSLGIVPLNKGGTGANLSDPGANRILMWDDTDNATVQAVVGTGLSYDASTNTLSATGGSGEANTASNLAGTGVGIWKDKSSVDLRFKRLKAGTNITITDNTDSVTISSTGGGAVELSSITAASATNSINNTQYKQNWNWTSLAGDTALVLNSTSTAAASNAQVGFGVLLKGANATSSQSTTAATFYNGHTGTSSTNTAARFLAESGTVNVAANFNPLIIIQRGGATNASGNGIHFYSNGGAGVNSIGVDGTLDNSLQIVGGNASGGQAMKFYTNSAIGSTPTNERMRIQNGGQVNIVGSLYLGDASTTASAKIHALSTTEQLRLAYDGSNYESTTVSSAGEVTKNAVGSGAKFSFSDSVNVTGDVRLMTAGNKLKIATGSNASLGTASMALATATVSTTAVTADSKIFVSYKNCVDCGSLYIGTVTAGTSFVILSTNLADASDVNWWIVN